MDKSSQQNERLVHLDLLRILAAFAVVINHVLGEHFYLTHYSPFVIFCKAFLRWAIPVFVMVSGTLFLDPSKNIPFKDIYGKYVKNILITFFVWSIIYEIFSDNPENSPGDVIIRVLIGPYHFWFLKMMLGLYIAVPILKTIVQNRHTEIYFLILALTSAYIVTPVLSALNETGYKIFEELYFWWKEMHLDIALGYTGYFVLGHYLSEETRGKRVSLILYFLGLLGGIGIFF